MKPRAVLAFVLVLASVLAFVGCEDCSSVYCGACPPSITFEIVEAGTGARVNDVTVTNSLNDALGIACAAGQADAGPGVCSYSFSAPTGSVTFVFSAPGHGQVSKTVKVPAAGEGCCACPYIAEPIQIALPRL
ncbi:MAG: hypothetical protein IT370_11900 [Deltaproteobacteria bacterium]|nr:hypothetical protein [Deltaproteobacteria bacterium]